MPKKILVILILLLALVACGPAASTTTPTPRPTEMPATASPTPLPTETLDAAPVPYPLTQPTPPLDAYPLSGGAYCGDGVCDGPEDGIKCPHDCPAAYPLSSAGQEVVAKIWVINPTDNAHLNVELLQPEDGGDTPRPTLILVPGGSGSSQDFLGTSAKRPTALLAAGYSVMLFDPDGRGRSEGVEDYDGAIQQDGLAAVILFTASLPMVDAEQIGVVSYSYGVTMAAGALASYPELPVRFLIDVEGPADRRDTGGCDDDHTGHLQGIAACDDEAFWSEREALTFIRQIQIPYRRIQTEQDHAQPDLAHAIAMINAAVDGDSPWVQLNDRPANERYDPAAPPAMLPEAMDGRFMELIQRYADELLDRS